MLYHLESPQADFSYPLGLDLPLVFSGWLMADEIKVNVLHVSLDQENLLSTEMNIQRQDVQAFFANTFSTAATHGFKFETCLPAELTPGSHKLEFSTKDQAGNKHFLGELHFRAFDQDFKTFSERFACIPSYLLMKVNGDLQESSFHNIGKKIATILAEQIDQSVSTKHVLDFGCGLGRVLNPLTKLYPEINFTGFDIDSSMIAWAQYLSKDSAFKFTTAINDLQDSVYDFIYAISVFTHLDETKEYWLEEVRRLLKPGARTFLTYHDETLFADLAGTPLLKNFSSGAKLDKYYVSGKGTPEGDTFMGTFYSTDYWEELVGNYFRIIKTVPRGIDGYQSFSLLERV